MQCVAAKTLWRCRPIPFRIFYAYSMPVRRKLVMVASHIFPYVPRHLSMADTVLWSSAGGATTDNTQALLGLLDN